MNIKNFIAGIILTGTITVTGIASFAIKAEEKTPINPNKQGPVQIVPKKKLAHIRSILDQLVKDGIITQEQEEAVIKAFAVKSEKCKLSPPGNGKGKKRTRKHNVLKELVKEGKLTDEQADAIRKAFKAAREKKDKTG